MAKRKTKIKNDVGINIVINIILILTAVVIMYPLWFVIIASISDPSHIAAGNVILFPRGITFDAYKALLDQKQLLIGYRNSILYMFGGTFTMFVVTLPMAYALSRKKLYGRRFINFLVVFSMYFSGGLIATYLLHCEIGWLDTIWVLIVPSTFQAYYLILARSNFESLPESMYEAASIDGASDFRYFISFVLPLSKAIIAVLFLFSALKWWNDYMRYQIYISNPNLQSLQVFIQQITSVLTQTVSEGAPEHIAEQRRMAELLKYSVVVVSSVPFCVIYLFVQKYFNKGVMIGAIKE